MKCAALGLVSGWCGFGCSKTEAITDLGAIVLVPNAPSHVKISGHDWIFKETLAANGKWMVTATETEWTVTPEDISRGMAPTDAKPGARISEFQDLTGLHTGVEAAGYFGQTLTRFTLKRDSN